MKNTINRLKKIIVTIFILLQIAAFNIHASEIHIAAAAGDQEKVQSLLETYPSLLESKDDDGNTPLISACWGPPANLPQETVAHYLIDKGANINAKNNNSGTPLYFAHRNYDLMKRLIDEGADVNIQAYGGLTPLHQAVNSANLEVVRLLIDYGADLNIRSQEGTILQRLINNISISNVEIAILLVESGAQLQEFSYGNTELHLVAIKGCAALVPTLIKQGANVDAVNDYGHTPLYYATKHGHRNVADSLISAGANISSIVETNYGKAPQLAETFKDGEAYLWYLGGGSPCDGYAVKTKEHLLIINPSGIDESPGAGLANGFINPNELTGQKITVLINHHSGDRYAPNISELARALPGADFVLNFKLADSIASELGTSNYRHAVPNESFSIGTIQIHTIPVMLKVFFESDGLAYLIEADGVKIFHAGLNVSNSKTIIDFLKPFGPIDLAILPIKGRHIQPTYQSFFYLLEQLMPETIYLIGDDLATEEHTKCIEILQPCNIPISYPEGGIATGERFHYQRETVNTESNLLQEKKIEIFPNPASQTMQIRGIGMLLNKANYQLTDLNGKKIKQGKLNSKTIDISELPKGIYMLSLNTTDGVITEKIVVE